MKLCVSTFLRVFTYKMAAKINWHTYGTKLRQSPYVYIGVGKGGTRALAPLFLQNVGLVPHFYISYCVANSVTDSFECGDNFL